MSQHLLGAWLLVLLLAAGGWTARFVPRGERCRTRETARKPPCPVMRKWMSLVRNVDEGINTSHDETILEKPQVLDKHKLASHRSPLDPPERHEIQAMKKTFTQLKSPGVFKAVGEFKTVLDWIQTYTHKTGKDKP